MIGYYILYIEIYFSGTLKPALLIEENVIHLIYINYY